MALLGQESEVAAAFNRSGPRGTIPLGDVEEDLCVYVEGRGDNEGAGLPTSVAAEAGRMCGCRGGAMALDELAAGSIGRTGARGRAGDR